MTCCLMFINFIILKITFQISPRILIRIPILHILFAQTIFSQLKELKFQSWTDFRQDVAKAVQLLSDRTAALFRRHFPNDKAMLSLAEFIDCLAKCFKILTSRVIKDQHNDMWKDALRVHYEVSLTISWSVFKVH